MARRPSLELRPSRVVGQQPEAVAHLLDAGLPFRKARDGHAIVIDSAGTRAVGRT